MKSRWKTLAKRLVLVLAGLAVGVALAESMLRVLHVGYPQPFAPDIHCGSKLAPGFRGWWCTEGFAPIRVNRAGFRDRDHPTAKPAATWRIAVLGDSFIEAFQVPLEKTCCAHLERELQSCEALGGKQVEVLSFGVSGHSTAQQLQVLQNYVWQFEPDMVLLAFYAGNDVVDNSPELAPYRVRPFFQLQNNELVLDNSFRQHPDFLKAQSSWTRIKVALINRSRILQLVAHARNARRQSAKVLDSPRDGAPGLYERCYLDPPDASLAQAWSLTERIILEMRDQTRKHGARFLLMCVTSDIQVNPDSQVRRAAEERLRVPDLGYPDRRMREFGKRRGIPVLCLSDTMLQYAQQHGAYLHGFPNTTLGAGHWNEEGHRLAGRLAAEFVCRQLPRDSPE